MQEDPQERSPSPRPKPKRKLGKALLRFHQWLGLILGAQLVLWVASGVIMSWFHIKDVRGETRSNLTFQPELVAQNFVAPGGIIAQTDGAQNVELTHFMGQIVYITSGNNQDYMFDALTGEKLSPLKEAKIKEIADQDYSGDADIIKARLLTKTPKEYRGVTPVWQVQYNDDINTRLYISPNNGNVLSRRNKIWRLYDFFWMLHIMDYDERENFNNPLLKGFAATGLLFVLSGLLLIIRRLWSGKYLHDLRTVLKKPANN